MAALASLHDRKLATEKTPNASPKMLEAGTLFGFAVGLGCGLCIGWLVKGKFRSKAVALATEKSPVSDICER